MPDMEKVIKGLEQFRSDIKPFCGGKADWERFDAGIAMLKEQEPLAVYEDKVNECVCGNGINRYWHPEYCGFCGKKLLWY